MPAIDSGGGRVAAVRLRLDIAYDGTEFAGWAAQAGRRTVAGTIDETLSTVFRVPVTVRGAGRTDAGVHAAGQVAHVDVPADALRHAYPRSRRPAGEPEFLPLVRRLARFLPADVRIAVPSKDTQLVQETHLTLEHILCDLVECILYPQQKGI